VAVVDRPAWTEVVGILLACAVLFVVIAKADRLQADRAADRARAAHVHAAPSAARPARTAGPRGIALPAGGGAEPAPQVAAPAHDGRTGSAALFALAAVGAAMTVAGAAVLRLSRRPTA
jgi:hypothetical protein